MDIERLRNDPAYWDEVAPEGATHYHPTGRDFSWYKRSDRCWEAWDVDGFWLEGTGSDDFFAAMIPRPSQPQWRGPEDGLPPVGTVAMGKMPAWRKEEKCKVIAHLHGSCVVVYGLGDNPDRWSTLAWCDQFYPLKSDKERAVEAVLKATPCPTLPRTVEAVVGDLYDAGLLRLPEEQS